MTKKRLFELIATYGADSKRWPDAEREAAFSYIRANPKITKTAMPEAKNLDQLLDGGKKEVACTDFLAERVLKSAQETDAKESPANDMAGSPAYIPKRQPAWRSIAATFVITTGVGFVIGQSAAAKSARIAEAETLLSLTLDNPYDSANLWEEL